MSSILDYHVFRKIYEQQNPSSIPVLESEMNEYPAWARWAVLITFVSAALVSGVHTVPTVWKSIEVGEIITPQIRNIVALASLAAIELAILLSAYLMAKGVKLAYFVMGIASAVAIMANLYSVINAFSSGSDGGALLVAVCLGIGAPLITLFTGKMYVDIHRADRIQDAKSRKKFRDDNIAWDKEVLREFKKQLPKGMSIPPVSEPSIGLSTVSNGHLAVSPSASILGHKKVANASELVRVHFADYPEDLNLSPRALAAKLNVGKSTVNNVQQELRANVHSENGHAEV